MLFFLVAITGITISMTSCGNKSKSDTSKTEVNSDNSTKIGKEYSSAYVCPMHCEGSGSDKEGKCPVCKMDYVKNKDHSADGHKHNGHGHGNHNH